MIIKRTLSVSTAGRFTRLHVERERPWFSAAALSSHCLVPVLKQNREKDFLGRVQSTGHDSHRVWIRRRAHATLTRGLECHLHHWLFLCVMQTHLCLWGSLLWPGPPLWRAPGPFLWSPLNTTIKAFTFHFAAKSGHTPKPIYLCSVLLVDPSTHIPPTLPWAILLTCDRTNQTDVNLNPRLFCRTSLAQEADSPLPFAHFYQLLVNGGSDLRLFAHHVSKVKYMRNLLGLRFTVNDNVKKKIPFYLCVD